MDDGSIDKMLDGLMERLADIEHERWSHWQRYLHSKCVPHGTDGALLIPAPLALRWQNQADTPYAKLSESEKESDRKQVRKYLDVIAVALRSSRQQ